MRNSSHKVFLCAGEIETGNIVTLSICRRNVALAGGVWMLTKHENGSSRFASRRDCLGEVFFPADYLAAANIVHARAGRYFLLDPVKNCNHLLRHHGGGV